MRYFVTGATGFVGSWVARQLTDRGESVVCLVRRSSNLRWLKDLPVEYCQGSLDEPASLKPGIEGADAVLHIAGITKALTPEEFYKGNVDATRNLLNATLAINPGVKKIVQVGSQAACGPSLPGEMKDENEDEQPITDYGKSKLQADRVAQEYMGKLPLTILRPPTVYGPRDSDVFEVFKNVKAGLNLKVGRHDPVVSIIHVHDLARGIISAANHARGAGEIYNIGNPDPCVWADVVRILQQVMNKKVLTVPIPKPLAHGFAGIMELASRISGKPSILNRQKILEVSAGYWVFSSEKISRELGFKTEIPLEKGLQDTFTWYVENQWL